MKWLLFIGLLFIGVGVFHLTKENYELKQVKLHPVPVAAIGVMVCGSLVGLIVSDTNGSMYEATPNSALAKEVIAVVGKMPSESKITMPLEVKCLGPAKPSNNRLNF